MIEFVTGNVLDEPAFAHGCNCLGVMGAGLAKHVRGRWPQAYDEYRKLCGQGLFTLGSVHEWHDWRTNQYVFNLGTQYGLGACARLDAIRESVDWMFRNSSARNLRVVAIPRIGCGYGGLRWSDVKVTLLRVMQHFPQTLRVYTLPKESDDDPVLHAG